MVDWVGTDERVAVQLTRVNTAAFHLLVTRFLAVAVVELSSKRGVLDTMPACLRIDD
jgi:hypothetical protein